MIYLNVVSSGSKGNCYTINTDDSLIIVDIGTSFSKLKDTLSNINLDQKELFLFLTHEHLDHTKGLKSLLTNFKPNVFCSMGTAIEISKKYEIDPSNFYILDVGKIYKIDGFEVIPFKVLHDGAEPFGYHFVINGKGVTFSTDLGVVTDDIIEYLNDSHLAILESNYEDSLLQNGSYPGFLKKRIESIKGHLSNRQAINTLSMINTKKLHTVFLGHISEENNRYEIIEKYVSYCNSHFHFTTKYLKQKESIENIPI
ncbi:MBL fold metallo-hydrolase [Deferribacter thermophilus]|uniref:MBL fold metallo-hydrolase n=1 Tax=Deferribacter thermophilus TaxID=53573 RepID=UPI003C29EC55